MVEEVKTNKSLVWMAVAIVLIGLMMLGMGYENYRAEEDSEKRDDAQRACISENFGKLTSALETRTELGNQTNQLRDEQRQLLTRRFDALMDLLAVSARNPNRSEEEQAALRAQFLKQIDDFEKQGMELNDRIAEAKAEQEKVKIPPYPKGTCD